MSDNPKTRGLPKDAWRDPFSAFNSWKYLMWKDWMEAIVAMDYKRHPEKYDYYPKNVIENVKKYAEKYKTFLPPYMVNIDPSNICNFNCSHWCNSKAFRKEQRVMMPPGHLVKLADFIGWWGVNSVCISGGGEPLAHDDFVALLYRLQYNGIKNGVICNGSLLDDKKAEAIVDTSSWCGFSIDAGTESTYSIVHGVNKNVFRKTMNKIERLIELKEKTESEVEITYKFLLHPLNAHEIVTAVKRAKKMGFDTFHLRPVCADNLYGQRHKTIDFSGYMEIINKQIEEAQKLEDDEFKFFGIRHKFGEEMERKVNFKRCLASPMMTTFGADGNCHLCCDVRGKTDRILCKHYPEPREILSVWGSEKHMKIIDSINPHECPRCTFSGLNEIIEGAIINDKMFKDFL